MIFWILVLIFSISLTIYILYNSHTFQIFIRTKSKHQELTQKLQPQTKGEYISKGYFSSEHKIIKKKQYSTLFKRQKINLTPCYAILKFQTIDANWELFFTLIKESGKFKEYMVLRCYPFQNHITSRASIEKIHSKIEPYSNKHALMQKLNKHPMHQILNQLLIENGEILNINSNNILYKGLLLNNKISKTKILHKINHINAIKDQIYTFGIKPY